MSSTVTFFSEVMGWRRRYAATEAAAEVCSACSQPLTAQDMTWVKPWKNAADDLVPAGVLKIE